jgi:Kae1-associated kinase Bud32
MAQQNSVIARGAEAVLYLAEHDGRKVLVKDRVKKGYRVPELDGRIRRQRTRHEESLLARARRAGVAAPRVWDMSEFKLVMDYIDGRRVKDWLNRMPKAERHQVAGLIGEAAAKMHEAGMVHGDLTTSNMILEGEAGKEPGRLFIIDFGLGKMSGRAEDRAVDLYLLYEALKAAHFKYLNDSWQYFLNSYSKHYSRAAEVLKRFEEISKRRRYKH